MKDFPYTADFFVKDFTEEFNQARYPYTYACDFIRAHQSNVQEMLNRGYGYIESRAEASNFMKFLNGGDEDYRHIATVFADAFCLEHGIKVPVILGYQINVSGPGDFAVGHIFSSHEAAFTWTQKNPRKEGFYTIETCFEK